MEFDGLALPVHSLNTLVVGSGAAGLCAARELVRHGQRDVAIVTERWGAGASFNAGSDKQTYYRLALAGSAGDSPRRMAEDLFTGGSMHGDLALCEAQHSAQAFFNLVGAGVPFPHDRYGGFVGYRTDHDPRGRGTSAGPLTSRLMCERLGAAVREAGVTVFDHHTVVALLADSPADGRRVCGAVAIDRQASSADTFGLVLFNALNVVLATGGPGGMYRASVYPGSQVGSTGLALSIGAAAHNLTESQFGLASVGFRWNLSGSYQQVVPRYVSTDAEGGDEREFLNEVFPDPGTLASAIFRKGYEWPFDCARVAGYGSSLIDLLVHRETAQRERRVFLDYTRNPSDPRGEGDFSLDVLDEEARDYLRRSGAEQATPIERLRAMNQPAVDLFADHGTDLGRDRLEIALCAQHSNGGLRVDTWWQSNIRHLFPIGEVAGTHGVRRPGGAALNAGQVGAIRSALYIARRYSQAPPDPAAFAEAARDQVGRCLDFARQVIGQAPDLALRPGAVIREVQERMSFFAAHLRRPDRIDAAVDDAWRLVSRTSGDLRVPTPTAVLSAFRARDLALVHAMYLEAIREYFARGGRSRGGALALDAEGECPCEALGDTWRCRLNPPGAFVDQHVLELWLDDATNVHQRWVDIRPLPDDDGWFEAVWNEFLRDQVVR